MEQYYRKTEMQGMVEGNGDCVSDLEEREGFGREHRGGEWWEEGVGFMRESAKIQSSEKTK